MDAKGIGKGQMLKALVCTKSKTINWKSENEEYAN